MPDYTRETSILICCFIVGSIEGKEIFIKIYCLLATLYLHLVAERQ